MISMVSSKFNVLTVVSIKETCYSKSEGNQHNQRNQPAVKDSVVHVKRTKRSKACLMSVYLELYLNLASFNDGFSSCSPALIP